MDSVWFTLPNGHRYEFTAAGDLRSVGFVDAEIPRTAKDWDDLYRAAIEWRRAHVAEILVASR